MAPTEVMTRVYAFMSKTAVMDATIVLLWQIAS
jgi:hypothetical protein